MRIRTLHGLLGPLCSIQDRLGSRPSAARQGPEGKKAGELGREPAPASDPCSPCWEVTGRGGTPACLRASPASAAPTAPAWPLGSVTGHRSHRSNALGRQGFLSWAICF